MKWTMGRILPATALVLILCNGGWTADTADSAKAKPEAAKTDDQVKVSVTAKDTKLTEVLDSLAKQSKARLIVESTVKGTLPSLSLADVTLESALSAVCKAGKLEWRRVYIAADSSLLEQPDKFAATVRLLGGLSFPDIMLVGSSTGKTGVHLTETSLVDKAQKKLSPELGLSEVYLITNDAAAAAKALKKDDGKDTSGDSAAIDKFTQLAKDQMDAFMKMTPEEREQALMSSINLMDQVDPSYMSTVMQTLLNTDQEALTRMMQRQTEALFHMPDEQRRQLLRFNMKASQMITPGQMQIIQEDMKVIMEEMKNEQGK